MEKYKYVVKNVFPFEYHSFMIPKIIRKYNL